LASHQKDVRRGLLVASLSGQRGQHLRPAPAYHGLDCRRLEWKAPTPAPTAVDERRGPRGMTPRRVLAAFIGATGVTLAWVVDAAGGGGRQDFPPRRHGARPRSWPPTHWGPTGRPTTARTARVVAAAIVTATGLGASTRHGARGSARGCRRAGAQRYGQPWRGARGPVCGCHRRDRSWAGGRQDNHWR
jgi:hypothetical protein